MQSVVVRQDDIVLVCDRRPLRPLRSLAYEGQTFRPGGRGWAGWARLAPAYFAIIYMQNVFRIFRYFVCSLKTCSSSLDDIMFLRNGSENRSISTKPIEKTETKPVLFFIDFVKPSFQSIFVMNDLFFPFFFLVFGHFWRQSYQNTKILRNFVYILQGKMGKTEKTERKSRN